MKLLFSLGVLGFCLIKPSFAETPLRALVDGPPQTRVTKPWVHPATGLPWTPANSTLSGPESWEISHGYVNGVYFSCHFGSNLCAGRPNKHTGEDLAVDSRSVLSIDKPVYAVNNGIVVFAQEHPDNGGHGTETVGYVVVIRHDVAEGSSQIQAPRYHGEADDPNCHDREQVPIEEISHIYSYYLHLGSLERDIEVGSHVRKGQPIGRLFEEQYVYYLDDTGQARRSSYSAHLHFEMWSRLKYENNIPIDADGYAEPGADFNNWPLIHPTCFFALNNEGVFVQQVSEAGNGVLHLHGQGLADVASLELSVYSPSAIILSLVGLSGPELRGEEYEFALTVAGMPASPRNVLGILGDNPATVELQAADGTELGAVGYPFSDIPGGNDPSSEPYYSAPAVRLWVLGLLHGFPFNQVAPMGFVTRAEFVKMVVLGAGVPIPTLNEPEACALAAEIFDDISPDDSHWYCPYVLAAYLHENENADMPTVERILSGHSALPNERISRAEAAKILANGFSLNVTEVQNFNDFEDVDGSEWFVPYVAIAKSLGIINGYHGGATLGPADPLLRGQAFALIERTLH